MSCRILGAAAACIGLVYSAPLTGQLFGQLAKSRAVGMRTAHESRIIVLDSPPSRVRAKVPWPGARSFMTDRCVGGITGVKAVWC
jgi:hypothetical protein